MNKIDSKNCRTVPGELSFGRSSLTQSNELPNEPEFRTFFQRKMNTRRASLTICSFHKKERKREKI